VKRHNTENETDELHRSLKKTHKKTLRKQQQKTEKKGKNFIII
jgi:hypothetical protein